MDQKLKTDTEGSSLQESSSVQDSSAVPDARAAAEPRAILKLPRPPSSSEGSNGSASEGAAPLEGAKEEQTVVRNLDPELIEDVELQELGSLVGTVFDERYEILEELARGGMGIVFKAQHLSLNRPVVIKVLKSTQVGSSTAKARFEREARRACQLDHPNIVTVHDFGYHGDLGYLVMEYVDGMTLSDYLKQCGPLPFVQFAPVVAAIASGLAEAHRQNIIHRDIKSSNIMLTFEGKRLRRVKILDFGLAKVEGAEEDDVTKKSNLIGTMGAMPPERILCKPTDCRVDLYALGVCAYRMVAGRRPFVGEDMHVLYQHVHEHPPPLTEMLPEGHDYPLVVLEWIHRLLAKDPDDRPRDAQEARDWLLETVTDRSVFRLDENTVEWLERSRGSSISNSSIEATNPSWSYTNPSGSFRSLLPGEYSTGGSGDASLSGTMPSWTSRSRGGDAADAAAAGNTNRTRVAVGVAVAFAAVAGAVTLGLTSAGEVEQPDDSGSAEAIQQIRPSPQPTSGEDVEKVFERIEADLARGAVGTAENLLDSIRGKLRNNTEHQVRAAEYQTRIDIDKHFRKAEQAEKALHIEKAIQAYDAVLSLDANNEQARSKHDELTSKVVLKVRADAAGEVYVDGERVGPTPLEALLSADLSRVEVRSDGYETWSTSLIPDGGTRLELSAELEPLREKSRPVQRTRPVKQPEEKASGIEDESLIPMD